MAIAWLAAGLQTNSGLVNTANTGVTFGSYAEFAIFASNSLYCEMEASFSILVPGNVLVDFGLFRRGASTQYAPTDGCYFRLNAAGLTGVVNYNGTENFGVVNTPFVYNPNTKYRFIISVTLREVEFWVNDNLLCVIATPDGQAQPCLSATLPFSIRHAHTSTAGGILSFYLNSYGVSSGGSLFAEPLSQRSAAIFGSYQGLSGGTMGGLTGGAVGSGTLTMPAAAIPANGSLVANLCSNLGGRSQETFTSGLALATDGILLAYQVPAGSVAILGKRLKISAVKIAAFVTTVMAGGTAIINEFKLAFGSTAANLATAEAAATKKPRLVLLPSLMQTVTLAQATATLISQPLGGTETFVNPIYVNPGEFVMIAITHQGTTIPTSGVICYDMQFDYSWE
jgi:hypothetical protein